DPFSWVVKTRRSSAALSAAWRGGRSALRGPAVAALIDTSASMILRSMTPLKARSADETDSGTRHRPTVPAHSSALDATSILTIDRSLTVSAPRQGPPPEQFATTIPPVDITGGCSSRQQRRKRYSGLPFSSG